MYIFTRSDFFHV